MKYTLSRSEKEILDILWKKQRWIACSELVDHFKMISSGPPMEGRIQNTFYRKLYYHHFTIAENLFFYFDLNNS